MRYLTHKLIYRDSSYCLIVVLSLEENSFYEFRMIFDIAGVTLRPFKFIMKLTERENLHESHLSDDLTLSFLLTDQKYEADEDLTDASDCRFKQFSWNSKDVWSEQEETICFDIKD
jgi:hypothetical protein